jgi:hypothetical protein
MVTRDDFTASSQDTVVVVHEDVAIVSTRLELTSGFGIAESVERVVPEQNGNQFRIDLTVPEPQLDKNATWRLTVLLPPNAEFVPTDPDDPNGEIEGFAELDRPPEARRVLVWWGHRDPTIPVLWTLLR